MLAIKILICLIAIWILLEVIIRLVAERGIETDFYGSINRHNVRALQDVFGVKVAKGGKWFHLGWIADPENEYYLIQKQDTNETWQTLERVKYGSWLSYDGPGNYRVQAISKTDNASKTIGTVTVDQEKVLSEESNAEIPLLSGEWQYLFKPFVGGNYLNDHCIYKDGLGNWRIMGITSHSQGDYQQEQQFVVGVSQSFPPADKFLEDTPIRMSGTLAWAPHVVQDKSQYHLFWSPHKLHHMTSNDGISWENAEIVMEKPFHKFFRDAMIIEVAPGQWLMYATGRGRWFSRIDIYQSFDLVHWQYIRPALTGSWGSERNFVTGSMESPFLIQRDSDYYLSITYNNETFFLSALLLQFKVFLNRKAYNNTLIFRAESPYDFGAYKGKRRTHSLVTQIECHAPVYVEIEGEWFVTTCGWPFAATLTGGEVAYTELNWERAKGRKIDVNKR